MSTVTRSSCWVEAREECRKSEGSLRNMKKNLRCTVWCSIGARRSSSNMCPMGLHDSCKVRRPCQVAARERNKLTCVTRCSATDGTISICPGDLHPSRHRLLFHYCHRADRGGAEPICHAATLGWIPDVLQFFSPASQAERDL
jgi:hypothetical protein